MKRKTKRTLRTYQLAQVSKLRHAADTKRNQNIRWRWAKPIVKRACNIGQGRRSLSLWFWHGYRAGIGDSGKDTNKRKSGEAHGELFDKFKSGCSGWDVYVYRLDVLLLRWDSCTVLIVIPARLEPTLVTVTNTMCHLFVSNLVPTRTCVTLFCHSRCRTNNSRWVIQILSWCCASGSRDAGILVLLSMRTQRTFWVSSGVAKLHAEVIRLRARR